MLTFAEFTVALATTLAMAAATLGAAWLLARRFFSDVSRTERVVATGTLAAALIAFPLLALGAVRLISAPAVAVVSGLELILALWVCRVGPPPPATAPLSAVDAATTGSRVFAFALAGLYAAAGVYTLERALSLPPVSWDSLFYHLPMVVEWTQTGALDPLYHPTGLHHSYFPGTGELFTLWTLLPWKHDFLAGLVNLPFIALSGLAVYQIAREFGAPARAARWAPPLYVLTPCLLRLTATSYVDPAVGAFLLLCVAWLLAFRRTRRPRELLLFSMAFGLAIGTKYTAVMMAAPLALLALWWLRDAPRRLSPLLLALPFALLGAFWYWRNLWLTGHPLYPSEVELLGWKVFAGAPIIVGDQVLDSTRSILGSLGELLESGDLWGALLGTDWAFTPELGVGPKLFPLLLLSAVAALRKRAAPEGGAVRWVSAITLLWLLSFLLLPYWLVWFFYLNVRFLLPAIGLMAALSSLALARAPAGAVALVVGLCVVPDLLMATLAFAFPARVALAVGSALVFGVAFALHERALSFRFKALAVLASLLLLFGGGYEVHSERERNRHEKYTHGYDVILLKGWLYAPGWRWLDETLGERPARIAVTGSDFLYPLYGPRWNRIVRYVDVNARAGGVHHAYPPGRFRQAPDRAAWLANLKTFGADYLVVYKFHDSKDWPIEAGWAQAEFPKRAEGELIRIYEVRR